MDHQDPRRRQNEAMHPTSNPRYSQGGHDATQQRRSYAATSGDRYRPTSITTSPTAAARGMGGSAGYSGYYQEPSAGAFSSAATMSQGAMGYHQSAEYGQDTRQTQGFTNPYSPAGMMYNVHQSSTGPSSVYDTSQQFSSRQPAAMQIMTPDVPAPYFQGEPNNPTSTSALQSQAAPSNTSSAYQQGVQGYSTGMATVGGMGSQQPASTAAEVPMDDQQYQSASSGMEEAYAAYQTALKQIFQNIRNGVLAEAGDSLLNVSDWLLSHVAELGLTSDDENLHSDRIKLWNDFNYAWLALFQRQKDIMQSGQSLQRSQSLVTQDSLEKMGKELIRLCDGIERHGLVDYQYGVWEEQIIAIITDCQDIYDPPGESSGAAGGSGN